MKRISGRPQIGSAFDQSIDAVTGKPQLMYAAGGQVGGQPDNVMDNRPIMANEGEFVVRNSAAKILGAGLLSALNDPRKAREIKGILSGARRGLLS